MTGQMAYAERQKQPVTLDSGLVHELWSLVKSMRDEWANLARTAQHREDELNALLQKMKLVGMADHLPTIEEVQEEWRKADLAVIGDAIKRHEFRHDPSFPNITREMYIAATGYEPEQDDLERCNCNKAGEVLHQSCGWDSKRNLPVFMPSSNVRR